MLHQKENGAWMATYVSQATYNAGTAAQRAGWTVDPGITSPNEHRNPVQYVNPNTPIQYGNAQQVTQSSEAQRQQMLFQMGLAYGAPNAPEYASLFSNAGQGQQQQPQAQQQQYMSYMTQGQLNQIQTRREFAAANAPGVVGGMSVASGGYITLTERKTYGQPQQFSPTQAKAYELAAGLEQLPVIAQLKGTSEYLSSSAQGSIFEIPVNYLVSPILRTPEMLGKTGIATAGILSAAVTGDVVAFQQGVPASRQAFMQAATDPMFYASSALTAGIIYKVGYSKPGSIVKEKVISSEVQPRTNILARTETRMGTEFIARTSDTVSVTYAKTIAGREIPFTRSTSFYSASAETSGISLKTPVLSRTAKLGSPESQSPMMVQTRAATGVEISSSVTGRFIPEWQARGIGIRDVSSFKPTKGASVGSAYGKFPHNVPYGEFSQTKAAPSFETTSLSIKYPTLVRGEVYSEITPTYKGVFNPTKSPAQFTSDVSFVRAVSSGGKISEISGMFKEMASTGERSLYGISLREGKATTRGIGMVEPSARGGTPISEGQVFPKFISPKDVTSVVSSRGTMTQLRVSSIGSEAGKAGTSAIQSMVGGVKAGQQTKTATMTVRPLVIQSPASMTSTMTQERTQFKQASFSGMKVKDTTRIGFEKTGMVNVRSFTGTQTSTSQASSFKFTPAQTTYQPQTPSIRITEITVGITQQPLKQTQPQITPPMPAQTQPPFTPTYQPPATPPFIPPYKPPYTPPPTMPPFLSFGDTDLAGFGGKSKKQKGKYSPSFIAVTLGIKGKPGKSEMTGFAIRPMALAGKKRK